MNTKEQFTTYSKKLSTIECGKEGPTAIPLVEQMLDSLKMEWSNPNLKILDPAFGFGTFLYFTYLKLLKYHDESHILNNMLYGYEIEPFRYQLTKNILKIKNLHNSDFLQGELNMKFDAVVANPPYQEKVGPNKTLPIWNKIVERSLKVLKDGGTMTMVHPSGWRNVDGNFKKIQKEILSYDLKDLEIHDEADGLKTFGTETRYDIYTLEKTKVDKTNTRIKFQDGTKMTLDVSNLEFIPNDSYELFNSLIAKKGEERVEVISDSTYHTQRPHLSREENNVFKYPCIYTINNEDIPTNGNGENKPWYSSVKEKHFEIPKLIWSNGRITSVGSFIDDAGEYGVTQFSYAIVDDVENLPLIKKAFDSAEFRKLMMAGAVGLNQIPYKVISTFRKDFWKKFV